MTPDFFKFPSRESQVFKSYVKACKVWAVVCDAFLYIIREPVEEDDGCIEITSVTRRSDLPKDAKIGNFDELSIDESQFVSAAKGLAAYCHAFP